MAGKKKSTAKSSRKPAAPQAYAGVWENPLIPHARLQELYTALLRCRMIESSLARATQRAPEAVAAGLLLNLRATDTVSSAAPSHRALKGAPLKHLLAATGTADAGYPAHGILPAIADSAAATNAALGAAFIHKQRAPHPDGSPVSDSDLVLHFTTDADECIAAARIADQHRLPILFVYKQKSSESKLSVAARHLGIPGIPLDCDDAIAAYRVAQEAVARARAGGGPTLIECMRYSVPQRRRPNAIAALERNLADKGLVTPRWKLTLLAAQRRELARARLAAAKLRKASR